MMMVMMMMVMMMMVVVMMMMNDNDTFDYVVVLHQLCIFMKPTLNLKCSGTCSYGIYLVHC